MHKHAAISCRVVKGHASWLWTSDGFESPCWNVEAVRVAFVLGSCDREAMAWSASTGGVTGEMIRDLMVESIERRFGSDPLPQPFPWPSDNGSCYRAAETIDFATQLGLVPCFTPVRSPQSKGIAEAFVKTFKSDYSAPAPYLAVPIPDGLRSPGLFGQERRSKVPPRP